MEKRSRLSLEVGVWTSDQKLMRACQRFLVGLIGQSEPLGEGPDDPRPELLPVNYDDKAFYEVLADELAGQTPDDARAATSH